MLLVTFKSYNALYACTVKINYLKVCFSFFFLVLIANFAVRIIIMISIALMVIPMNIPPIHDTALLNDGAILCMYVCMYIIFSNYHIQKLTKHCGAIFSGISLFICNKNNTL